MSKQLKTYLREALETRFDDIDGGVLINAQMLNSEATYNFRKAMHLRKLKYTVLRGAIAAHAFKAKGYDLKELQGVLRGPVGLLYSKEEGSAIKSAKALFEWKKEAKDKLVEWKGALLDGSVVSAKDAEKLRDAKGKRELLAEIAGTIQAPAQKLASTIKEIYQKMAYAVDAVAKKKDGK